MKCEFATIKGNQESVKMLGHEVPKKGAFKYLESILQKEVDIDDDVSHKIRADWMKWHGAPGFLFDHKIPFKIRENFIEQQ